MSQIFQTLVFSLQDVIPFAVQASLCTFTITFLAERLFIRYLCYRSSYEYQLPLHNSKSDIEDLGGQTFGLTNLLACNTSQLIKLNELEVACLIAPGLQADLPSRFAPTSGFLSFDLDVPEVLLQAAGPQEGITGYLTDDDAAPHLALMSYQLHQV